MWGMLTWICGGEDTEARKSGDKWGRAQYKEKARREKKNRGIKACREGKGTRPENQNEKEEREHNNGGF